MELPADVQIIGTLPQKTISLKPYFPAFAISDDGLEVWRVVPAQRGPMANKVYELPCTEREPGSRTLAKDPHAMPRYFYMVTDAGGKIHRMALDRLQRLAVKVASERGESHRIYTGPPPDGEVVRRGRGIPDE